MKEFTFRLKADVSYLEEQFKGAAAELANIAAQAGKTEKKLEIFQEANAYLIQIETMLGKIQKKYPDLFDKIFDGVDKQVKDALAPFKQMPEVIGQALDQVGAKMQDVLSGKNKDATLSEIKGWAKEIKKAADILDIKIDFGFLDDKKSSKAKVEDMVSVLKQLREAYRTTSDAAERANIAPIVPEAKAKKKRGKKNAGTLEDVEGTGVGTSVGDGKHSGSGKHVEQLIKSYRQLETAIINARNAASSDDDESLEAFAKELNLLVKSFNLDPSSEIKLSEILTDEANSIEDIMDKIKKEFNIDVPFISSIDDIEREVQRYLDILDEMSKATDRKIKNALLTESSDIQNKFADLSEDTLDIFDALGDPDEGLTKDAAIKQIADILGVQIPKASDVAGDSVTNTGNKIETAAEDATTKLKALEDRINEIVKNASKHQLEFSVILNGDDVTVRKGKDKTTTDIVETTGNMMSSLGKYFVDSHTHTTTSKTTNDADLKSFARLKKYGVTNHNAIFGSDGVSLYDFSQVSEEDMQKAIEMVEDLGQSGNVTNEQLSNIFKTLNEGYDVVKHFDADNLGEFAKYIDNVTKNTQESIDPLKQFKGIVDYLTGGRVDWSKYSKVLEGFKPENAKNIFDQIVRTRTGDEIDTYNFDKKSFADVVTELTLANSAGEQLSEALGNVKHASADAEAAIKSFGEEIDEALVQETGDLESKLERLKDIAEEYGANISQRDRNTLESLIDQDNEKELTGSKADRLSDLQEKIDAADEALVAFEEQYDKIILKLENGKKVEILPNDKGLRDLYKFMDEGDGRTFNGIDVADVEYIRKVSATTEDAINEVYKQSKQAESQVEETNKKLREQEDLYQQVRTAIKGTLEEVVGMDFTAVALEDIEREIKDGLITTLEEAIIRFKEMNNLTDDISIRPVGEYQRVAEDWDYYHGNRYVDEDNETVVNKNEYDSLKQKTSTEDIGQEYKDLEALRQKISEVEAAIVNKTLAFHQEADAVEVNVKDEIDRLELLRNKLEEITVTVNNKTNAFEAEKNTVASSVADELIELNKLKEKLDAIAGQVKAIGKISIVDQPKEKKSKEKKSKPLDDTPLKGEQLGMDLDAAAQDTKELAAAEEKVEAAVEQTNDALDEQIAKEKELIKQKGTLNFLENQAKEYAKTASTKWSDDQKEAYEQLIAKIQEYKKSKNKLTDEELNSIRQIVNGYKIQAQTIINAQESAEKASKAFGLKELNKATGSKNNLEALSRGFDSKTVTEGLGKVRSAYTALVEAQQKFNDGHEPTNEERVAYQQLTNEYNQAAKALDALFKASQKMENNRWSAPINQSDLDNVEKLETAMQNAISAAENGRVKFGQFNKETGELEYSVRRSNGTWDHFKAQVDQAGMAVVGLNGKIKTTNGIIRDFTGGIATKFKNAMQVFSGYDLFFEGVAQVKKGIQYVRDIDKALTELRKVTSATEEEYAQFLQTASKTSGVIGTTVADLTNATADFARLGYSIVESAQLAEAASIYKNVGDGIEDVSHASESIISTMKAFGIEAEDAMGIVDRFNEIGNNFAISSTGIGDALQRSASALAAAGNSIDESIALITAANSVVQNPEQVGTALKTLSMRLRGTKTELAEAGEDTDGMADSVSQLHQKLLALSHNKVDIMADENTYKNSTEILREMSDAWGEMTDMERAAALELMGGKRQGNILSSIIENFDIVDDVIKKSLDAENSALKENEKYLDSIEGRISKFTNSVQTMWMNAINSDVVKGFVDLGIDLINIFDQMNQNNPAGIFGSLAVIGGTLFGAWKGIPALWTAVSAASKAKIAAITGETKAIQNLNVQQGIANIKSSEAIASDMKEAAISAVVTGETGKETIATNLNTIEKIKNALATQGVVGADAEAVIAAMGLTTANTGLTASFTAATKAAGAFLLALLKNPLTWIVAGIAAVAAQVIYLNGAFDRAKDKLSETSKELSETQDEIKSINNELKTTKERIDELNSKDKLSFTEEEELKNLKAQNDELERKLKLEEQNAKIQKNKQAIDALNVFNLDDSFKSKTVMSPTGRGTGHASLEEIEVAPEMDRLLEDRRKNVELLEAAMKDLEDAQTKALANPEDANAQDVYTNALKNVQKYEQAVATSESNIMSLIKEREELYGNVGYFEGDETTLSVFQKQWNEALDQINLDNYQAQIAFDTTGKVAQDALEWAADRAGFTAEEIRTAFASGNFTGFEELIQMFIDLGIIPNDSLDSIQIVVDMLTEADKAANSAAKALDNYKNSLPNIVGQLSQFEEGLSDLSGAYNEFVENGAASAKSLEGLKEVFGAGEMAEEYEAFVRILGDSNSTITEVQNAIEGIATSYLNTLDLAAGVAEEDIRVIATSLEELGVKNAEQLVRSRIAAYEEIKDIYGTDLKNFANAEDAKNAVMSQVLGEHLGINAKLINDLADQYGIDLSNFTGTAAEKVEAAKEAAKLIAQAYAQAESAKVLAQYSSQMSENPDDIRAETRAIKNANVAYNRAFNSKSQEILAAIDALEFTGHQSAMEKIGEYYDPLDFDFSKFDDLGGGSGSGSGKDSLTDFDWIEHYFDSIDAQIEAAEARLGKTLDDVAHIGARNDVINGIITLYKRKLPDIDKIIKAYEARANALYSSFSGDIKAKIKNGSLDLSELDNDLASRIQEYFDYVGEASNWKIELDNIKVEISEKALERFNNVMDAYDNEISISASANDLIESQIDLLEEQGERISKVYYESMIANTNNQLALMEKQRSAMIAELNKALANDEIKKGSSQWFEMVAAISDVEANIYDATISIESFNNAIRDLHWQEFDRIVESISNIAEESANLRELLGEDSDMVDELGEWTAQGVTSLGLLAQEMENAEYRAKLYADEIAYLDKEYKNGNYSQDEYNEKLQELKDGQWDSIKAYEDAKDAIIDLNKVRVDAIKDGIQKEIDAYEELIEKQKESLQAKKDEHDWANTLKDHTDEIDSIQRQIDALAGDSSASAAAKRKQLEEELAKANEELNEAYYDREIEIAQETLDKELELYRENKESEMEAWDEYLTHEEKVLQDSFNSVKANAELIHSTILETAKTYGISITSNITDPWKKGQNAIASYSTAFDGATSHYMTQLGIVKLELQNLQREADLTAQALANALIQDLNMPSLEVGGLENVNDTIGAGSTVTGSKNYTVKNGDTLWDIAKAYLGDATRWKEIYEANKDKINDPNLIYVGQNLVIPGVQVSNSYKPKGSSSSSNADKAGMSDADKAALEAAGKAWNNAKTQAEKDAAHAAAEAIRDKYGYSGGSDGSEYIKKKYAKGTTGVKSDELAWIDEHGLEEIVMHAQGGKLAYLTKGSSVIPHDISENLIELGKVDPHTWMDKNRPNTTPANIVAQNNNFELKFGSLINIEHADKDSIPEIKAAVQKQLDSYMKNLNSGIKKYAR